MSYLPEAAHLGLHHPDKYILKAKSNFTLWTTEYIFTVFYFNQIKYCNELLVPALA